MARGNQKYGNGLSEGWGHKMTREVDEAIAEYYRNRKRWTLAGEPVGAER